MTTWKYTDTLQRIVSRTLQDGRSESALVTSAEVQKWVEEGNTPLPADPQTPEQKRNEIELQRDATLAAGLTWNGNKYHIDPTMIAALNGRLTLWQEGKIAPDARLRVRRMDNVVELLDRAQHADLAAALHEHGDAIYAASWMGKDKLK